MLTVISSICLWLIVSGQVGLLTLTVVAQEPTTEPTALPTPTPFATLTTTPSPINTPTVEPSPAQTPSDPDATPIGRVVEFRVDDDDIDQGTCVQFSWVVKGDYAWVEFNILRDGKNPYLVSETDDRQECPTEDTEYELMVSWLDGTYTKSERIKVKVDSNNGDGDSGNGSGTSATPASFVQVTPILLPSTPIPVVVTPVGALGEIRYLPETGGAPPHNTLVESINSILLRSKNDTIQNYLDWVLWSIFTGGLSLLWGRKIIVGLISLIISISRDPYEN
jgi:hypothetical protein